MKRTGIVRTLDREGRFCLPAEIRMSQGLEYGTLMEVWLNEDGIIMLKKWTGMCALCSAQKDLVSIGERVLCRECVNMFSTKEMRAELQQEK